MAAVVYIMTIRGTVSSMTVPDIILAVLTLAQVSYALRLEYVYSCAGGAVSKSKWGKGDCYYDMGQAGLEEPSLPVWTMQATGNGKGEKGNKRGRKGDEKRRKKKTKEEKELGKRKKKREKGRQEGGARA